MQKKSYLLICLAVLTSILSGCTNVIRASEELYMKPGALDPAVPSERIVFDKYSFRFMEKYRVSHLWFGFGGCGYGSLRTTKTPEVESGVNIWRKYSSAIFERDNLIWNQKDEFSSEDFNLTSRFRSIKRTAPVTEYNPATKNREVVGYKELEDGLQAMCGQSWTGINMAISLQFYEYSLADWDEAVRKNPRFADPRKSQVKIGANTWTVYDSGIQPPEKTTFTRPYRLYVLPVGDTGYSMGWRLNANEDSLKNPQAFAAMEKMFMRQLESVRIEPWTEQTAAEQEALRLKALAIQREECIEKYQRRPKDAPRWCHVHLGITPATH